MTFDSNQPIYYVLLKNDRIVYDGVLPYWKTAVGAGVLATLGEVDCAYFGSMGQPPVALDTDEIIRQGIRAEEDKIREIAQRRTM